MGIIEKILGSETNTVETAELENVLEELKNLPEDPADFYIAKIALRNEGDAEMVIKAVSEKKIVILDIMPISKQPNRLKNMLSKLKSHVSKAGGDIALLNDMLVILTPPKIRIIKAKPKAR